jgi:hypothetical protein
MSTDSISPPSHRAALVVTPRPDAWGRMSLFTIPLRHSGSAMMMISSGLWSKLRLKLGGWPDIREPLPPKPKRKHKKRYQRLRNQAQALEAQANQTRFRKQIDIRTFAYHVG